MVMGPRCEVLVGNVIADRYLVTAPLGEGVTGSVFAVEHLVTGRPAAMKVLRPRYVGVDVLLRVFHGDARAAWSLPHPGLCEVLDAGQLDDGTPFFVMERLVGEPLAQRVARDRLSFGAGVDMMMQLLAALDAIHRRDLVARDLRPANLFLCHRRGCRPVLKLLDLGFARLAPPQRVGADWDTLLGSPTGDAASALALPHYLSPERTRGEQGIGPASDLFVAGVIFYEAITAQKPFAAPSFTGLVARIREGAPRPMAELRPDVPLELDALVQRLLAANPDARPRSAAAVQDELRAIYERVRRPASGFASRPSFAVGLPTVPPPDPFDDETHTNRSLASLLPEPPDEPDETERTRLRSDDEETATTKLSPELRAKIDAMMAAAESAPAVEPRDPGDAEAEPRPTTRRSP